MEAIIIVRVIPEHEAFTITEEHSRTEGILEAIIIVRVIPGHEAFTITEEHSRTEGRHFIRTEIWPKIKKNLLIHAFYPI